MTNFAYFNNKFLPLDEIFISPMDRGYLFGDGVYEVIRVYNKECFLLNEHMQRLYNSLDHIDLKLKTDIRPHIQSIIEKNTITEGYIYIQVTRSGDERTHSYNNIQNEPNVFIYAKAFDTHPYNHCIDQGLKAITTKDLRWQRADIKSINLLYNCMALVSAQKKDAQEAIFIDDKGYVTECSAANIFIVENEEIKTPPLSANILPGITRKFLIMALGEHGKTVKETPIKKDSLFTADEVFITSTTKEALPLYEIDGEKIKRGPICTLARSFFNMPSDN